MDAETFDLRAVLANRAYPTSSVRVWMDEKVWFQIDAVKSKLATTTDANEVESLEAELTRLEEQRDSEAFTIHIRAISNRATEDIISKALSQIPVKRDMFGHEEFDQTRAREKLITELSFAAYITKIVSPTGAEQVLSGDEETRRDVVRAFLAEAPPFSVEIVDRAIGALSRKFAVDDAEAKSPDFS